MSVIGVFGELLVTAGVLALLYVGWQLWFADAIIGGQQREVAASLAEQWAAQTPSDEADEPADGGADTDAVEPPTADPVILPEAADAEVFGIIRIPRFGEDNQVQVAGGISRARTLDPIGYGHYPGTAMPGDIGNFAVAAHRGGNGAPLNLIANLQIGDAIVVETADGWYTYRFRNLEYVWPTEVDVLLPVPQVQGAAANGRYITLTSCSPIDGNAERIIAYGVFESFTPRTDAGPPSSLTEGVS